ncbi:hypothetical protein PQD13_gp62 [Gordonia phage Clawz]|uniref:Uncharacterized protein n=1 Tax=Gordonia phage Clawz TaxID=2743910 RepID=A0AAE7K697_9CAUD|nr:hypothetical protein PQD13_gp62 [Gordonia phage Clawz]QKY79974.1 hypothetical protein SEA_CLAWZ_62 [Gordonia phage Clawz]
MDGELVGVIWEIEEPHLRSMLERAAAGESVDMILLGEMANAEHEHRTQD